jgi:ribonucleoside-diphosphate reductase alpha chain
MIEKRDGTQESLDLEKIHKVLTWATEGIKGVSVSEIELRSQLQFFDGMKSKDIHETLTKTAADLISEDTPNYQHVASRLVNFNLRKEVYGQFEPWHLKKLVEKNVACGHYTSELLDWYSPEEWERLNKFVKHDRDYEISYAGMGQFTGKYLCQNRVTKEYYETPQVTYMLVAATLFHSYPKETRLKYVKDYYDALSVFDISIPTPILAGVRTPTKQFSSCVLIDCGDSLNSINSTSTAIVNYVSKKAGIGLNAGRIRGIGSEIRGGEIKHTGMIPFLKYFQAALKSCSQGGVRGGAATVHFPLWHQEIETLVVLKNNKGVEENRVRHMDYSVQMNGVMYERLLTGGNITLFSPHDVPRLSEAFYAGDNEKFRELYEKYERAWSIPKTSIPAIDLFQQVIDERVNTGRIYIQNIDHCNTHSSFDQTKHPISMSNLCQEITLPTRPFESLSDENGRIALCTLSAINWGNIRKPEDFEKPCELAVRALDNLLSYQEYPMLQAEFSTQEFRTLGIGVINLAYFLAKNGVRYDDSALALVDEYMEAMSYYLIKASVQLAKEKGPCDLSHETKYGMGIFPFETRKESVDELVPHQTRYDWDALREEVKEYGIRNATLMALMPSESSSQLSNATNGVEPPRGFISEKASKDGVLKMVVPEYYHLRNKYDLLWDQKSPEGYIKIMAIIQKWIDQTISSNTSYNPENYPDGKLPLQELIKDLVMCYKYGLKTLYYNNTNDGATDEIDDGLHRPDTKVSAVESETNEEEEECDSCVL